MLFFHPIYSRLPLVSKQTKAVGSSSLRQQPRHDMHCLLEFACSDQRLNFRCAEPLHAEKLCAVCVLLMSPPAVSGSVDESIVVRDRGGRWDRDQVFPLITRISGLFLQLPLCGLKRILAAGDPTNSVVTSPMPCLYWRTQRYRSASSEATMTT